MAVLSRRLASVLTITVESSFYFAFAEFESMSTTTNTSHSRYSDSNFLSYIPEDNLPRG